MAQGRRNTETVDQRVKDKLDAKHAADDLLAMAMGAQATGEVVNPVPAKGQAPDMPGSMPPAGMVAVRVGNGVAYVPAEMVDKIRFQGPKKETTPIGDGLSLAVSEKGAVSIYGMGRFPLTSYAPNLLKVLAKRDAIVGFVKANKDKLSWGKDE